MRVTLRRRIRRRPYTANIALFNNTTNQPDMPLADPVKPERSNYYDVGVDQVVLPGLTMGVDAYYKNARDMIDDGQFGAAVVLTQFNYARGLQRGRRIQAQIHQRQLQRLCELLL